ncbi:MAG: hypothetical protein P1U53_16290 [Sulfitobacter sp.]|nr:hypothetical protein [Sulfitobacter sp.]
MELVLHAGSHYTEADRLVKSLLRNQDMLRKRGVAVPGPGSYRPIIRDTLNAMDQHAASGEAREVLLDVILDDALADRVILSHPNFFRTPATALQGGYLYPSAAPRMGHMAALFPDDDIEIFLSIRNPAALLPIFFDVAADKSDEGFWGGRGPENIRWSETIADIRSAVPRAEITLWCNEDTPLIWAEIIREMTGLEHHEKIVGGFDLLASIMSKEGMQRFRAYIDSHPEMSEMQKRRVIAAFLDKFALEEEIEEELDMPGWTDETVETLTEIYDEDVTAISRMPGVTLISP